ncbi:olfactory receptor 6B1-like [Sphaerodactylus townsendi]|uniref:olfactory receptor 6B1-like n=1 Tax=Sphaerodactylus townsendi TaxID=933632 RepID=UPI0020272074|nr:olfactory receptor 6B1-like [Sphaerodactylus townsendi]
MATMVGNVLIVVLVVIDKKLHNPMYFFLGNLSCLESCYSSTVLPRMLFSFLTGDKTLSMAGCMTQFYLCASLVSSECYLFAMMSYDHYVAICKPLRYTTLMNDRLCLQLAAGSWVNRFMVMSVLLYLMLRMTFCGPNIIDHFFCDLTPLMKLSCSNIHKMELANYITAPLLTLPPFILTITSYVSIISTIVNIPSTTGRKKAFSTCSSHLIVVTIFYGTIIVVYVLSKTPTLKELNKVFSVFYSFLTPLVNPLICILRNREVKDALEKMCWKIYVLEK